MRGIAPSEKDTGTATLETRLWAAADWLRTNSALSAGQYSQTVHGRSVLRFANATFGARRKELEKVVAGRRGPPRFLAGEFCVRHQSDTKGAGGCYTTGPRERASIALP